jgi:hypothetical protein
MIWGRQLSVDGTSRVTGDGQARFCEGCALKAHGIQSPVMVTAAKLSSQPRTESCVVATTALRSVDGEVVGRNVSERKDNRAMCTDILHFPARVLVIQAVMAATGERG